MSSVDLTKSLLDDIFGHLAISPEYDVIHDDEALKISIFGDDLSFLIGYRGESINALQSMLGLILFNRLGERVNLIVDINDYRESRKEKIEEITRNYIDRARFSQQDVEMPFMSPYERRQVHLFVSGYDDIESESTGEGRFRRVVLRSLS